MRILRTTASVARLPVNVRRGVALLLAVGVAYLDVVTGFELSLSLLYLVPTAFAAWVLGRRWGLLLALLSALLWLSADLLAGHLYTSSAIAAWNTLIRLGFFLVVVALLLALKEQLELITHLARTDSLTGLLTRGPFFDALESEAQRSRRYAHPLTVAYLDVDDFKVVNDAHGHPAGDAVLMTLADTLKRGTRATDVAARIGGDEFALLIPESDEVAARSTLERLRESVSQATAADGSRVTVSVGAICFRQLPEDTASVTSAVDALMYDVKRAGKNAVRFTSAP